MQPTAWQECSSAERMLLRAEHAPWDFLWRAVVGFGTLPTFLGLHGQEGSAWTFIWHFVVILLALRAVPALLLRMLPFSGRIRSAWAARRALARRYDSYQWQKLLGIGSGLLAYLAVSTKAQPAPLVVAIVCLIAGGLGSVVWGRRRQGRPNEVLEAVLRR